MGISMEVFDVRCGRSIEGNPTGLWGSETTELWDDPRNTSLLKSASKIIHTHSVQSYTYFIEQQDATDFICSQIPYHYH